MPFSDTFQYFLTGNGHLARFHSCPSGLIKYVPRFPVDSVSPLFLSFSFCNLMISFSFMLVSSSFSLL